MKEASEKIFNDYEASLRFLHFWKKFLRMRSKVEKEYAELFYSLTSETSKNLGTYQQYVDHFKKSESCIAEAYVQFIKKLGMANAELIIPPKSGDQNINDYNSVMSKMRTAKTEFENHIKAIVKDIKAKMKKGDDEMREPDVLIRDAAKDVGLKYEAYRQQIHSLSQNLKEKFISSTVTTHNLITGFIQFQRELFQSCLKILDIIEGNLAAISGAEIWKTSHEPNIQVFYNHDFENQQAIIEFLKNVLENETSGKSFKPSFMSKTKRKSNLTPKLSLQLPDNHQTSQKVQASQYDQISPKQHLTGIQSNPPLKPESSEEYPGVQKDKDYESSDEEFLPSTYAKVADDGKGIYEEIVDSYIEDMSTNKSLACEKSIADANFHSMQSDLDWQKQNRFSPLRDQSKLGLVNVSGDGNPSNQIPTIGQPKFTQFDVKANEEETVIDPFSEPFQNTITANTGRTTNSKICFDLDGPFSTGPRCSSPQMQKAMQTRERPDSEVVRSGHLNSDKSTRQVPLGNSDDPFAVTSQKTGPNFPIDCDDPFDVKFINNQSITANTKSENPKTLQSSKMIVNEYGETQAHRHNSYNQTKGLPRYEHSENWKGLLDSCDFLFNESFTNNSEPDGSSLFSLSSQQIDIVSNVGNSGTSTSRSSTTSNDKIKVTFANEPEINDPFICPPVPAITSKTTAVVGNLSKETSMSDSYIYTINSKDESYPTQGMSASFSNNIKPPLTSSNQFPSGDDQSHLLNENIETKRILDDPFTVSVKPPAINLLATASSSTISPMTESHEDVIAGDGVQKPILQVFDDPFSIPTTITTTTTNSPINSINQSINNDNIAHGSRLTSQKPQVTGTTNETVRHVGNPVNSSQFDSVIDTSMKSVQSPHFYSPQASLIPNLGNRQEPNQKETNVRMELNNQPGVTKTGIISNVLQNKPSNVKTTMSARMSYSNPILAAKMTNVASPKLIPPRKSIDRGYAGSRINNMPQIPSQENSFAFNGATTQMPQKSDLQLKITENLNYLHRINEMPIIEIKGVVFCRFEKAVLTKALQECLSMNDCLVKFQTLKMIGGKVLIEPNPVVSYEMTGQEFLRSFAVSSKAAMAQIREHNEASIPIIRYVNVPISGSTGPLEFQLIVVDDRHASGEIKVSLTVQQNPIQSWINNFNRIASDSQVTARDIQLIVDIGRYTKSPSNWNSNPFPILQSAHPNFVGCEKCWDPQNHRFSLKMDNIVWDGSSILERRVFNFILRQPEGYTPLDIERKDGPLNVFAKFNITSCNMTDLGIDMLSDEPQRFKIGKIERSVCTGSYVAMF